MHKNDANWVKLAKAKGTWAMCSLPCASRDGGIAGCPQGQRRLKLSASLDWRACHPVQRTRPVQRAPTQPQSKPSCYIHKCNSPKTRQPSTICMHRYNSYFTWAGKHALGVVCCPDMAFSLSSRSSQKRCSCAHSRTSDMVGGFTCHTGTFPTRQSLRLVSHTAQGLQPKLLTVV